MTQETITLLREQVSFEHDLKKPENEKEYINKLVELLSNDLDFHVFNSKYASHNFHSFPAKFPPQLPSKFIMNLTEPNDIVLDPMSGSGTTVLEAFLCDRKGIGFDIDPLAIKISRVKTSPLNPDTVRRQLREILHNVNNKILHENINIEETLSHQWDIKTKRFIDYWFSKETQRELLLLINEISQIEDTNIRRFFELAFSAIIITKSGGVSLAFDLAHTRPHKAKVVISKNGDILYGKEMQKSELPRIKILTKRLRSPIDEFEKRCILNIEGLINIEKTLKPPDIEFGNAQNLPLDNNSIDLIVTSPPYASNAIDYMRAHKFSLVWFGYKIDDLSRKRKEYFGGETMSNVQYESMPDYTSKIVADISKSDYKKGKVLHRYYSEMKRTLVEIHRVLKPGKAAIVVVGNSIMRGKDTQTHICLADIGQSIGFSVPKIGIRKLDRNKRMLPAGIETNTKSAIQQRMHEEYVIGFYKPENTGSF